jgi:ADP-heptose:LPS heptosyltransferase
MWRGNPEIKYDRTRSMELATLLPLLGDDAEWVWLQKELSDEEAVLLEQNRHITFVGNDPKDFNDAAALIDLMDLVITVDTAVAHLAGALGKPVWVLLPYNAESRWLLDRTDSPWYPSVRLFRQREIGNWGDVVEQVRHELTGMIAGG